MEGLVIPILYNSKVGHYSPFFQRISTSTLRNLNAPWALASRLAALP
jgi:hypothetical protein